MALGVMSSPARIALSLRRIRRSPEIPVREPVATSRTPSE
jgi:hypothetical protein